MSRGRAENPKEALILSDAQRQLSPPPNGHSGSGWWAVQRQPSCFYPDSKSLVCQVRRNKNVLSKRFNFSVSMGKSTDNGKQLKKHIHERLLFKTSWHSHFQWNLAGCSQYLIQKFFRNEGLLQASFIWLGLDFAFSHIPPAEVRGWWQGAQFLCLFLCRTQPASITSLLLSAAVFKRGWCEAGKEPITWSPFWEQSKKLSEGQSIRSLRRLLMKSLKEPRTVEKGLWMVPWQ